MPRHAGHFRFTIVVAVVAVMLVLLTTGFVEWLFRTLPSTEGMLHLAGLKAPVTVARDDLGIPHIIAANQADAYFALGFVHAQDRLWQMEMQRRLGAGRLAEVLGPKVLPTDEFMRTLGIYALAERDFDCLSPEVQRAIEAYGAGVNAYLTSRSHPLPPEFLLLRYAPEPWKPADSLVWGRVMALQLAGNWHEELLRARLLETLPAGQVADLWPTAPKDGPTTIGLDRTFLDHMLAAIPDALRPQLASNVWAVSGAHSTTGKPILANDPHLGFQAPVLWYLATITAPGLQVAGGTVPGVPFHIVGHNSRIAWGLTTTQSDTQDLFIEKPSGDGYLAPEGTEQFTTRRETIAVHGAPSVTITVRATRHGPLISDLLGNKAEGRLLALSAVALEAGNTTSQALYRMNRADDWRAFNAALHDFRMPQQNIAYADVEGHIGLISPGHVPIRRNGDGTLPRPGWAGDYDWTGWIPFDDLPRVLDPPAGFIVNANNKVVPDSYPYLLAVTWPESYRAQRIVDRLGDQPQHSVADMAALQMDELSLMAVDLKPLLLRTAPRGKRAMMAHAMLAAWDGTAARQRAEPLIFSVWLTRLQHDLLAPWLGPQADELPINPLFLKAVLNGRTVWCGPPGGPPPATCDDRVAGALDHALADIAKSHGDDMGKWHWGDAHRATFNALLFHHVPWLDTLTRLSIATGGDDFTVQRGTFVASGPATFRHVHGAGLRAVYDLADLDGSRFVIATGQSGNPLSRHWGDLLERWRDGDSVTLPPRSPAPHVEVLEPAN